jgi:hypothetical protein
MSTCAPHRRGFMGTGREGPPMASEPFVIPPPGPPLPMTSWAAIVTKRLRGLLPEVRAARVGDRIRWEYGGHIVTLTPERSTWWITFMKPTGVSAPRHPAVYVERHDQFTAEACGGTIVSFFSEHCTTESQRYPAQHA